jgi:superfamily II DNA or RNA helicase
MIEKYPHINFSLVQKMIINEDKPCTGIFLGTGVGKTLPTSVLAEGRTLVLCPKQQKVDRTWERTNEHFSLGKDITVTNYDMFFRHWEEYERFDSLILDECHRFDPSEDSNARQLVARLSNSETRVVGFTATPYRGAKPIWR